MDKLKRKFNYNYDTNKKSQSLIHHNSQHNAILDSGATSHYLQPSAPVPINKPATHIHVNLPDGSIIQSSHECSLNHPLLSTDVNKAYLSD